MTQAVSRTRFNSAGLVRILAELAVADVADPKQTFAERLGEWLDFKDALALYSALNSAATGARSTPTNAWRSNPRCARRGRSWSAATTRRSTNRAMPECRLRPDASGRFGVAFGLFCAF